MKRTKKAEANHKREEFLKAALLHCYQTLALTSAGGRFFYPTAAESNSYLQTYADMLAKYKELGES